MAANKKGSPAKDAIIFIPGLGRQAVDQRPENIARKLAGALDRQAPRAELKFRVMGMPEEEYGSSYRAQVRTIGVSEPGQEDVVPVADLFELDYRDNLSRRFKERNPFSKALIMLGVLIRGLWPSVTSFKLQSKDIRDKIQMLTISSIMLAVGAYMFVVLGAGLQTLGDIKAYVENEAPPELKQNARTPAAGTENAAVPPDDQPVTERSSQTAAPIVAPGGDLNGDSGNSRPAPNTGNPTDPNSDENRKDGSTGAGARKWRQTPSLLQMTVLLFAALGVFWRKSLKEFVGVVATEYVCACNYLRLADHKQVLLGQAAALLEHIAKKGETYRSVHFISYSFGTLLAIDLLFPHTQPGARLAMVKRLVTIGCPFDLVRTYWPSYFNRRHRVDQTPERWINIYAPLDVFGSNFRNDRQLQPANQGVSLRSDKAAMVSPDTNIAYDAGLQAEELGLFDVITVKGIKLHSHYWSDEDAPELSCFDSVVAHLFEGSPVLQKIESPQEPDQALPDE